MNNEVSAKNNLEGYVHKKAKIDKVPVDLESLLPQITRVSCQMPKRGSKRTQM